MNRLPIHGQVGEEGFNLGHTHFLWMPFLVKEDVAPDPANIGIFCAQRVMLQANDVSNLVQQFPGMALHDYTSNLWQLSLTGTAKSSILAIGEHPVRRENSTPVLFCQVVQGLPMRKMVLLGEGMTHRINIPVGVAKDDSAESHVRWTLAALAYHRMARNLTARFG
jgi:hypothetical protein